MASSKPFVIDIEKLNKFVNGDLGIADNIHKVQVTPIIDKAQTAKDKEIFTKLQEPNKKSGIHAVEKTFITSALENYKPLIELVKVSLEMFSHLEYTIALLAGGPNPKNLQNSFSYAFASNKEDQKKIITGYEAQPVPPEAPEPLKPNSIFLGYFRRNGPTGNVYSLNPGGNINGRQYDNTSNNFVWPQVTNYQTYYNEELDKITPKVQALDNETRQLVIEGRKSSIPDEWSDMFKDMWLGGTNDDKKLDGVNAGMLAVFPPNLKYYYKPKEIEYLGNKVLIDIEDDYKVYVDQVTTITESEYYETFLIFANLDENKSNNGGNPSIGSFKPSSLTSSNPLLKAIKYFVKKVLDVIISKFIPALSTLKSLIQNPVKFLGDILMTKLKEHFELLDISIKDKDKYDKTRQKYWTFDDKFVLDGKTVLDVGLFKITIDIKDGVPSFNIGKEELPKGNRENPLIKQVANLVAMPLNVLDGIIKIFTDFMKSLFKVQELPSNVADFLSFQDIKDLLSTNKLFEFLGATNGDVKTIPMLNIPTDGYLSVLPQVIQAFMKMIIQFINGFIGIPNTIFNLQLVPDIPIPQ